MHGAQRPDAVFLDQMTIDHLELELMKARSEVDPERCYTALERCFRAVEDQTRLDALYSR
jgi:hypothetical protein